MHFRVSPLGDLGDHLPNSPCQKTFKVNDMRIPHLVLSLLALTASTLVLAVQDGAFDGALPLPEPDTLALLGAGAVALFIARLRNKK